MLNFYFTYPIVCTLLLLLYELKWSTFYTPMKIETFIFLVITMIVSTFLGYINKDKFQYIRLEKMPKRNSRITIVVCCFSFIEYIIAMQIPLFSIILGLSSYKDFSGIPSLHPIIVTFAVFYAQYLFYLFLNFKKRSLLLEYIALFIFVLLFQFNRGGMILSLLMSSMMYLASLNIEYGNIQYKKLLKFLIYGILVLFIFGCLGNMRHGFAWNDSHYIEFYGKIYDFPEILPKQFMWSYIYMTTPLNNFNFNILFNDFNPTMWSFLASLFPDFISKRLFSDILGTCILEDINFNTTIAYGFAYVNGGFFGMAFLFIFIFFGFSIIINKLPLKPQYRMTSLVIMNIIVIFSFFTHTLSTSSVSFPLIYPLLTAFRLRL